MENSYIYTVNITSEGFKEKIISSFKTLENCEESEAGRVILYLLTHIFHYYSFTKDNNEREDYYQKIKNILDKYDEFICEKDKLRILFRINNKEIFNYYFNKNKEQLIKTMENVVLVNSKLGDFEPYDYQGYLDLKYGVGKYYVIDLNFAELSNSYNIFATFREQLNLFEKNIGMFDYGFLFNNMSFFELESLAIKEVKKDNKYLKKLVNGMFLEYMDGNVEIDKLYSALSDNDIKKVFFTVAEEYLTFYETLLFEESLTDKFDRILALSMDDNIKFDIDFDNIVNFFSVNCFIALKELMKIPPKERKNSVLYLNCFKAFLKYMVCRFECELENEDVIVLSNLFHRLVANGLRKSLSILLITNKKELYHYFKSNELYVSSFSLEQIKNYNAKQYLNLKKMNNGSKNQRLVLSALIYLGYDYTKESKLLNSNGCASIISYVSEKSDEEKEKFKNFLKKDFSVLSYKKETIDEIIRMYEYLTLNKVNKITISKVIKCVNSVENILYPNNIHIAKELEKLNYISKGDPLIEKVAGILLYDEYRFRLLSTIPDISGNLDGYYYQMVELHDAGIISNGIGDYVLPNEKVASSCLTPKGKAASCLKHGATNVNGRFFKVEKDGEIVAYSWVWRCGDVLCFDNIEVTKEFISNSNFEEILFNIYKNVADELIKTTTKIEDRGIKLVIVGRNPIDVKIGVLDKLSKVNDYTQKLFKPNSKEELYLKDSEEVQVILSGNYEENLNLEDVDPIYKYKRKEVSKFKDFNYKELESKINAIYFDYCIDNNIKYTKLSLNAYVDGFINEDWFVGIREDGKKDIFYAGKDDRALKEIEEYTKQTICFNSGIAIIKPGSEIINEILDSTNYLIDKRALMECLKSCDVKKYNSDNKFLHGSHNLSTIASILLDGEITSSYYGNRENYGWNNGRYFISLAKKEKSHSLMSSCVYLPSFILNGDICTFSTDNKNMILDYVANMFVNTSYPVRPNLCNNEYQVLNSISLDRADGITVSEYNLDDLAKIIILQDYLDSELPLVSAEKEQIIDKELVKRYIRFKR